MLLAAGAVTAQADDLESLHIVNTNLDFRPGWTLQIHSRVRTFEDLKTFNQARVGPILMWQALPRLNLIAGYYFIHQNSRGVHRTTDLQRYWGGGQIRVVGRPKWTLDTRHLFERFNPEPETRPDYWRVRNRAMVTLKTPKVQPYWGAEALRQQKIWYGRYSAGIQFRPQKRVLMGIGWEYRDAPVGVGSHVLVTMLQFDAYRHAPQHID